MKRKSSIYIKDILQAISKIEEFVEGMSFEGFLSDDKTSSAVIRKIEIIGEAAKQLPKDVRDRFKDVPWQEMAKTRDKMIHFYFGVDYEIVWRIIKESLPPLKHRLNEIYQILIKEEEDEDLRRDKNNT